MIRNDMEFYSDGQRCSAWHFPAQGDALTGPGGRPAIVMAHGLGGTKDAGLQPLAERFSATGLDVLAFDYRGFGESDAEPRQTVSLSRQIHDYRSALAAAAQLPGVDPNRLVLWGLSLSGSHAIRAAAGREDVVAVIALVPLTNGLAAGRAALLQQRPMTALRSAMAGLASRLAVASGRAPHLMPLASRPGDPGAFTLAGSYDSYAAMAGPTWCNQIDSAVGVEISKVRTAAAARSLRARLLMQIAEFDRYVPAHSIAKTALQGKGEVRRYPCDHFDAWPGGQWFDKIVTDQVAFLTRVLAVEPLANSATQSMR
jgi:pimeloyl-ACP methyl ester carboxylesterase